MGSKTFEGIRFAAFPKDHPPPHVHAYYAEVAVIVVLSMEQRVVTLAQRRDAIEPLNAKLSDVKHVLRVAGQHFDELVLLWEGAQG